MDLIDLIDKKVVKVPLESTEKISVIKELAGILDKAGRIRNLVKIEDDLMARENQGSTGLENGIAVPHAKTDAVEKVTLALGISPGGVDFGSVDGKPSHIFFLILAPPDQPRLHVEILSEIARLTKSPAVRTYLMNANTPEEIVDFFKEE
ncbi:MAG: PTS sugar transporter subunit IIA [Spirochaetia bacterium]